MVVAQIAYNHLNPVAKAKCDALIATDVLYATNNNNTFVTAACWADDLKSFTSAYSNWHYIDIPFSLDGTSTNGVSTASFDVVRAIRLCVTNLQNPSLSISNQAFYLRFLLHFVGDIQQPLHCSTAVSATRTTGDGGGNTFYVTNNNWSNLHSFWDSGGGYIYDFIARPVNSSGQSILDAKVTQIEADYPYNYSTNLGTINDPYVWALEGWNLARTNCYVGVTNNTPPAPAYLSTTMAITEQRLAQGGHRLADLINTLYPTNIIVKVPKISGTNFILSWTATIGTTYQVQWKQNLNDALWNSQTSIVAGVSSMTYTDKIISTQKFYRLAQ